MSNVDAILSQLRTALKEELRAEVRAEIIAELGGARPQAPKKKPGPKPKAQASLPNPKSSPLRVKKGVRRTEEDVKAAGHALRVWIRANPGSRIDQASEALGVPVKDLQLPVRYLLKGKQISKKGKLRGTTYYAVK